MEGRRERKVRATRERIFAVALDLFVRNGYAATTIREIADGAGVSKVTFHSHYRTKDRLLHALTDIYLEAMLELLDELTARAKRGKLRAEDFQGLAIKAFHATPTIGRDLAIELLGAILGTPTSERLTRETREGFAAITAHLQDSGLVRRDLDTRTIANAAANLVAGAFLFWLNEPDESGPAEVVAFLARAFWVVDGSGDAA